MIDRDRDQVTKNQMENDNNNMNVSEKRNHFVYLTISVIVCRAWEIEWEKEQCKHLAEYRSCRNKNQNTPNISDNH